MPKTDDRSLYVLGEERQELTSRESVLGGGVVRYKRRWAEPQSKTAMVR